MKFIKSLFFVGIYGRIKMIVTFIKKGDKVRVSIRFRGRAITHKEIGRDVLERFASEMEDVAQIEQKAKMEGRSMLLQLAPKTDK